MSRSSLSFRSVSCSATMPRPMPPMKSLVPCRGKQLSQQLAKGSWPAAWHDMAGQKGPDHPAEGCSGRSVHRQATACLTIVSSPVPPVKSLMPCANSKGPAFFPQQSRPACLVAGGLAAVPAGYALLCAHSLDPSVSHACFPRSSNKLLVVGKRCKADQVIQVCKTQTASLVLAPSSALIIP